MSHALVGDALLKLLGGYSRGVYVDLTLSRTLPVAPGDSIQQPEAVLAEGGGPFSRAPAGFIHPGLKVAAAKDVGFDPEDPEEAQTADDEPNPPLSEGLTAKYVIGQPALPYLGVLVQPLARDLVELLNG